MEERCSGSSITEISNHNWMPFGMTLQTNFKNNVDDNNNNNF